MINLNKKIKYAIIFFMLSCVFYSLFIISTYFKCKFSNVQTIFFNKNKYSTIFGDFVFDEDIIKDALVNNAFLRLKKIDQAGPIKYFNYAIPFSRYDHSLGVCALIKRYNGSLNEQLAGLFHDISHTAFSHVADFIFSNGENSEHSYQDSKHLWYISNSDAFNICKKYNLPIELLDPDSGNYQMLERSLPEMCADRIEYNLHTAYLYNLLSQDEIESILSHLHYDTVTYYKNNELITEKNWFFDDILHAKKFALLPLHFIKTLWNAPWNMIFYKYFSTLIKYAFSKKYITKEDFHFNHDMHILNQLYEVNDPYVIYMLDLLFNIFDNFEIIIDDNAKYDEIYKGKFRGINPLVLFNGANWAQRLTEIDFDFNIMYNISKSDCEKGYRVKFKKPHLYSDVIKK